MLQTGERETEILLGNKQLLGIFFVAAVLLGIAFTGGYMVGRGPASKRSGALNAADVSSTAQTSPAASSSSGGAGGETHSVSAEDGNLSSANSAGSPDPSASAAARHRPGDSEGLLGARKKKTAQLADTELTVPKPLKLDEFAPQSGQEFLQVTSVGHEEADGVAAVLRKKGFQAHAVAKPGNANLYRVLIGPIHDAGELSSTRDALRKTGFRDVFVQHY